MIKKQFWRYVLPSMIAFSFSGIYGIVDGFFVGRSLGDVGLAISSGKKIKKLKKNIREIHYYYY